MADPGDTIFPVNQLFLDILWDFGELDKIEVCRLHGKSWIRHCLTLEGPNAAQSMFIVSDNGGLSFITPPNFPWNPKSFLTTF